VKQSNTSTLLRLCALVAMFVLVGADLSGRAQNTNSSTTNDASMQNDNTTTNANMGRRGRRGRRSTRAGNMNANTGDATGSMSDNANMAGDTSMQNTNANSGDMSMPATGTSGRRRRGRRRAAAAAPAGATMETMPADTSGAMPAMQSSGAMSSLGRVGDPASLDGTYTGTINYPDAGMTGDATLTITGNNFTLESGGNTQTGTLTTQAFPGQTAVSMRFGTELPAKILSLRGKKTGSGLMLMNTSGESHQFSFHSGGGGGAMSGGRRRRGHRHTAPATPPAEQPATPPPSL
jgi:hypothetical protein